MFLIMKCINNKFSDKCVKIINSMKYCHKNIKELIKELEKLKIQDNYNDILKNREV